jgi:hypothetical protein
VPKTCLELPIFAILIWDQIRQAIKADFLLVLLMPELKAWLRVKGERLVQKELRRTLLKYKLHTDQELFDKAYEYIRQYY